MYIIQCLKLSRQVCLWKEFKNHVNNTGYAIGVGVHELTEELDDLSQTSDEKKKGNSILRRNARVEGKKESEKN